MDPPSQVLVSKATSRSHGLFHLLIDVIDHILLNRLPMLEIRLIHFVCLWLRIQPYLYLLNH